MDFETIFSQIGSFGRRQRLIYSLLCLPIILGTIHFMAGVFLAARTDFRCLLNHETSENATFRLSPNVTGPTRPWDNKTSGWSRCERYDIDLGDRLNDDLDFKTLSMNYTVKCNSFVYDKTTYELTTVTEFNLVCDRAWLRTTADSLYPLGLMLGTTVVGNLADRYGRRPILCFTLIVNWISGLLVAVSPEIISYLIFRSIVGFSVEGMSLVAYICVIEMVSTEWRVAAGIGMSLVSSLGTILTVGFAYLIPHWRILQIAITIPSFISLLSWWFVPESVRWLVISGRREEAKNMILDTASRNGVELSSDTLDGILTPNRGSRSALKTPSIFDLLRYPNLRRKTFLLTFSLFLLNCTYFGLSWSTFNPDGDTHANFAISGLVQILAQILAFATLDRWGRRSILCSSLILTGTFLLLTTLVPADKPWLTTFITMMGKLAISTSLTTANIFVTESYPTVIRSLGVGTCGTCSLIGGIIAPSIIDLSTVRKQLPFVILGSGALIAGVLVRLLPETLNKKLLNSIEEGER